jgi:hypothetical protein
VTYLDESSAGLRKIWVRPWRWLEKLPNSLIGFIGGIVAMK